MVCENRGGSLKARRKSQSCPYERGGKVEAQALSREVSELASKFSLRYLHLHSSKLLRCLSRCRSC